MGNIQRHMILNFTDTYGNPVYVRGDDGFLYISLYIVTAPKRTVFSMKTTSISATAQQAFSFLQRLWPDGDMLTLRKDGLLRIGQSR